MDSKKREVCGLLEACVGETDNFSSFSSSFSSFSSPSGVCLLSLPLQGFGGGVVGCLVLRSVFGRGWLWLWWMWWLRSRAWRECFHERPCIVVRQDSELLKA